MLSDQHRRHAIGVLCLLVGAIALWLNVLDPELGAKYAMFQSGSLRMVPVLAVLWLALPEMQKGGAGGILFLFAMLCAVAMVFARGKTALKLLVPAIGALMLLGYLRRFTALLGDKPRS